MMGRGRVSTSRDGRVGVDRWRTSLGDGGPESARRRALSRCPSCFRRLSVGTRPPPARPAPTTRRVAAAATLRRSWTSRHLRQQTKKTTAKGGRRPPPQPLGPGARLPPRTHRGSLIRNGRGRPLEFREKPSCRGREPRMTGRSATHSMGATSLFTVGGRDGAPPGRMAAAVTRRIGWGEARRRRASSRVRAGRGYTDHAHDTVLAHARSWCEVSYLQFALRGLRAVAQ